MTTTAGRARAVLRRTATMGSCSQTHHEHIARAAADVDLLDIEQEAVAKYSKALVARVRAGAADELFIDCGGYGCAAERNADYTAVLALIEQDTFRAAHDAEASAGTHLYDELCSLCAVASEPHRPKGGLG